MLISITLKCNYVVTLFRHLLEDSWTIKSNKRYEDPLKYALYAKVQSVLTYNNNSFSRSKGISDL